MSKYYFLSRNLKNVFQSTLHNLVLATAVFILACQSAFSLFREKKGILKVKVDKNK